ncbi:protein root UVB sensitive 5-like isoform X2 [Coffea arabica]|uniref:Protein root UVB sensitive 5-like isoform X2 n=1 Tax=Coffea arabica TaxID=13443 RepID=A0A6P6SKV1_COFAR|nr:protein root UVB sensitive 5-like isoform X2 [Coffea arabica]
MSSWSLHLSLPKVRSESWQRSFPLRPRVKLHPNLQILCTSPHSDIRGGRPDEDQESEPPRRKDRRGQGNVILVERYGNGTSKRYILDDDSGIRTFIEEQVSQSNGSHGSQTSDMELPWLPQSVKDFWLPTGFPGSVSDDYLAYMLLQFPTNVTGWICHTFVTSSLLKAVGVGSFSGTTAAASAAAIRWVSKDGIGAVGRLFVGGRFGSLFDDDPKQWRMYADFIGSAGSIFDLTTQLYPAYFLPLASLGNLAKAVASGLKDPSFRVIQNHFAIAGNLGEIAAKEEVWEVAAELLGLAIGILALDTPGFSSSYSSLTLTWLSVRVLHLWLRYQSLSVLQFNTINLKRACILVNSHVVHSTIPGFRECNRMENILVWQKFSKPRLQFGASLEELVGGERCSSMVRFLLKLYAKEKHILAVNQVQLRELEVFITFKEGATSLSVLRSVWQAHWLHQNWGWSNNVQDQLEQSLGKLEERFDDFMEQLESSGWDPSQLNLKVPKEICIEEPAAVLSNNNA